MKKRSITFALLLLAVVLTGYGVSGTYARYATNDTGTGTAQVAKWNVTVNGFEGSAGSKTINLVPESSDYVASNKIAPSLTAYGELEFVMTGTEVATDIEFTVGNITGFSGAGADSSVSLKVEYQEEDSDQWNTILANDGKYLISRSLTQVQSPDTDTVKVRVGVYWDNASNAHNIADTYNGEHVTQLTATITANAKQHIAADD